MNSLQISKKLLECDEDKLIELKYSAPKIGSLSKNDVFVQSKALLLKIHVITGWTLPTGEILNILIDQFQKKLVEDYPSLNVEEVEYAFRHSGTSVEDFGKEFNLNLIDKVLWPYEVRRREASRHEEQMKPPPQKKTYDPEEVLNQYRYDIETAFQAIRKGYKPIIHIYFAETLIQDGLMKNGENINDFLVSVVNDPNRKNLYVHD